MAITYTLDTMLQDSSNAVTCVSAAEQQCCLFVWVLTVFLKAPAAGSKGLKKEGSLAALILKNLWPSIKKVPWIKKSQEPEVPLNKLPILFSVLAGFKPTL